MNFEEMTCCDYFTEDGDCLLGWSCGDCGDDDE